MKKDTEQENGYEIFINETKPYMSITFSFAVPRADCFWMRLFKTMSRKSPCCAKRLVFLPTGFQIYLSINIQQKKRMNLRLLVYNVDHSKKCSFPPQFDGPSHPVNMQRANAPLF